MKVEKMNEDATLVTRKLKDSMIANLGQICDVKSIMEQQALIKTANKINEWSYKQKEHESILKGVFPTQRDGQSLVIIEQVEDEEIGIINKAIVLFGGDRFRMTYNDLYCFYL